MNMGLTGGIATGKSTVARMLVKRGAILIDADQIAREVVLPGTPGLSAVVERFGDKVLAEDGTLNRKKLGERVFADEEARRDLEAILHPRIRALMKERLLKHETENSRKLVVGDVPLLFETGSNRMFSEVMVVYVPERVQLERLIIRNKLSPEEAKKRIAAQMSIEEKKKLADIVIDNSGSLAETEEQVEHFWKRKGLT